MKTRLAVTVVALLVTSSCRPCAAEPVSPGAKLCGPLSAHYLIHYYKGASSLNDVLKQMGWNQSDSPVSLQQIRDCLQLHGIDSMAVRLGHRGKYLTRTPVLVHTQREGGHFLVLLPTSTADSAETYEPGIGEVSRSWESLHAESPDYALVTGDEESPMGDGLVPAISRSGGMPLAVILGLAMIASGLGLGMQRQVSDHDSTMRAL